MARPIKARLMLKLFNGDAGRAKSLMRKALNKGMVRRDEKGRKVADNTFKEEKTKRARKP